MSSSLAERQAAFMRAILDEAAAAPEGWGNSQAAGMTVYRGNYRFAVMEALADTFERTKRYVGEDAFRQAAINHVITHPPSGWAIEQTGVGFDLTCAELFEANPEVGELAWLEWAMLVTSTAPDTTMLDPAGFAGATAEFGDERWMQLQLEMQPGAISRVVRHNLTALWNALDNEETVEIDLSVPEPQGCIVWREGETPTFLLVEPDFAHSFAAMQDGASYSEVIGHLAGDEPSDAAVQDAATRAGSYIGQWLQEGMVVGIKA